MLSWFGANVGLNDLVDVVATSVLIYYVLLLIRGTRAVQILTGVLVLLGLWGLANLFHLSLLGTILQLLVAVGVVSLPIIFQPELRRALEQLGRGGVFRMGYEESESRRSRDPTIAMLADAAMLLSRSRTGALVVIEQQSGLKDFSESGTMLDAKISVELLLAIFNTRSPLHDGAVIVRGNTIAAAGCFLPLADPRPAERRLGTRHRAALGISEQTDAVVIVVSEESGGIALARAGRLTRPVEDEQRLVRMLLATTRAPRQRRAPADFITALRTRLFPQMRRGTTRADRPQELHT
ncbi:MAG: diadenylate cyclase CdaA [Candidatus Tyrphobacter sp.]